VKKEMAFFGDFSSFEDEKWLYRMKYTDILGIVAPILKISGSIFEEVQPFTFFTTVNKMVV
jgi:hypothetical protein